MTPEVQVALIVMVGTVVTQIPAILIAWGNRKRQIVSDEKIDSTQGQMVKLNEHVNSHTDQLVQATKTLAHTVGRTEGVAEGAAMAQGIAAEVTKAVEAGKATR
jgi:hypothetical protein